MATKPKDVTQQDFLGVKDVQKLLGFGRDKSSRLINELNAELEKKGYLVIPHKIVRSYLLQRFAMDGKF